MAQTRNNGHIVAIGGGGFSMEPDNSLLDDYVLSLSRRHPARVCFIPTASADSASYIVKFYRAFSGRSITTDVTLFDSPLLSRRPSRSSELAAFVADQDVIYVGGGSTANLLAVWRSHRLDEALRDAWVSGTVLTGVSAGMICWFSGGVTDSFGGLDHLKDGLGLIGATACPHYGGNERRLAFHKSVAEATVGYAAEDGAALHFAGSALAEVVGSHPEASAYRVERLHGRVIETRLPARFLGQRAAGSVPHVDKSETA